MTTSGTAPFQFQHRPDLHTLPTSTVAQEVDLHGTVTADRASGEMVYSVRGHGLVRIASDMLTQTVIDLPPDVQPHNIHSTRLTTINDQQRLILAANDAERVAAVTLSGAPDFTLGRPKVPPYDDPSVPYKPTDTLVIGETLYLTDGYGAQAITRYDLSKRDWVDSFGSKNTDEAVNGQFGTAHGIAMAPDGKHLIIADRWHSRIQVHTLGGAYVRTHALPDGAWPCFVEFIEWQGQSLALIPNLYDPNRERPAPIYIAAGTTFEILSTVRPKEDLGIEAAQRIHHAGWHIHDGKLYLICQSWNPGAFFVLEQVQ